MHANTEDPDPPLFAERNSTGMRTMQVQEEGYNHK
jgi:hypothetical protein